MLEYNYNKREIGCLRGIRKNRCNLATLFYVKESMKKTTNKLTKVERRLAIVKDAILQLKLDVYKTGIYGYITLPSSILVEKRNSPGEQVQPLLCNLGKKEFCGVCAKGAIFLSTIRKEDNLLLVDLNNSGYVITDWLTKDKLFSRKNLDLIEAYYESSTGILEAGKITWKNLDKIEQSINKFVKKYPSNNRNVRTGRLLAILNNMVKNKGIFKP